MSNFVVTGGKWTAISTPNANAFGSSVLRWDSSLGLKNSITFSTDPQSESYTAVAPGGKLIVGSFTIVAQATGDNQEPFINRLVISTKVDGKRYPLPIDIQVSVVGGAIVCSLGATVPFTVSYTDFAIQVLGLATSREGDNLSNVVTANPGTTATFYFLAEIIETPSDPPVPTSTSAAFNDKECLVGTTPEIPEPGLPPIPIIPDPIPIEPIIPVCVIPEIPEPVGPTIVIPVLPNIPPGPPSNGGGCIPFITSERICIEKCSDDKSDIKVIYYGRCNYHIVLYEHCCFDDPPCCEWQCCGGSWQLYGGGWAGNQCCGGKDCFSKEQYYLEYTPTGEVDEPPAPGDGGCWYMTHMFDCGPVLNEETIGGCVQTIDGQPQCFNTTEAECDGDWSVNPCGEEVFEYATYIYQGCGKEGGESLALALAESGDVVGPIEGSWEPPPDFEEVGCTVTDIQEAPPCGQGEDDEDNPDKEPESCKSPPDCPCECEGQVIKWCDGCGDPPPPPECDSPCRWIAARNGTNEDDEYIYVWELVDECPPGSDDEPCCCPEPADPPTGEWDEATLDCGDCNPPPPPPPECDESGCTWKLVVDQSVKTWELVEAENYCEKTNEDYPDRETNCCCPYPADANPYDYDEDDTLVIDCVTEDDDNCIQPPALGCCVVGEDNFENKTEDECGVLGGDWTEGDCPDECCCNMTLNQLQVEVGSPPCNLTFIPNNTAFTSCYCIEVAGTWQHYPADQVLTNDCSGKGFGDKSGSITICYDTDTGEWVLTGTVPVYGKVFEMRSPPGQEDPCTSTPSGAPVTFSGAWTWDDCDSCGPTHTFSVTLQITGNCNGGTG